MLAAIKVSGDHRVMNIECNNKDTGKKSKFICKCMTNSPTASRRVGNTGADADTVLYVDSHRVKCKGKKTAAWSSKYFKQGSQMVVEKNQKQP